jgi:uroporphyrin-III C-methyltransferase / precorrin-2 dehydrogenase / sirohydrochlorin ferrochelatase
MSGTDAVFPVFLKLAGRRVLLVGGGTVAASKLAGLQEAGAEVVVVAPQVLASIERSGAPIVRRVFQPSDLDGVSFVVSAAPPDVNRQVSAVADACGLFVNAVDDPAHASAYLGGVVRRGGVTLSISTNGAAPALAGLLREGLDAVLPPDLHDWTSVARAARPGWKAGGVPMAARRPLLLEALNRIYGKQETRDRGRETGNRRPETGNGRRATRDGNQEGAPRGFVSLVGAGPGSPDLLTTRAVRALAAADLVLYDALVSAETLELAPHARRFPVGKRAGRPSISQNTIHKLMIRAARQGQRVVRLKGGDPFVFGRGGEEAIALRAAGVPFEVIPGVTSAVAAPLLAGIPVTHRGVSSGILVVSGHAESAWRDALASVAPGSVTLVILMGLDHRDAIASALVERGWSRDTLAAIVKGASWPEQHTAIGTLAELSSLGSDPDGLPGTIIVGDVVRLRALIATSNSDRERDLAHVERALEGA